MLKSWESLGKHFSFKCSKHILSLERYTFEVRHLDNLSCQGRIQLFILLTSDILNNIGVYHQNNGINYQNFGNNIESTLSLYRTQGKKLIFHSNALNTKNSVVMIKGKAKRSHFIYGSTILRVTSEFQANITPWRIEASKNKEIERLKLWHLDKDQFFILDAFVFFHWPLFTILLNMCKSNTDTTTLFL